MFSKRLFQKTSGKREALLWKGSGSDRASSSCEGIYKIPNNDPHDKTSHAYLRNWFLFMTVVCQNDPHHHASVAEMNETSPGCRRPCSENDSSSHWRSSLLCAQLYVQQPGRKKRTLSLVAPHSDGVLTLAAGWPCLCMGGLTTVLLRMLSFRVRRFHTV